LFDSLPSLSSVTTRTGGRTCSIIVTFIPPVPLSSDSLDNHEIHRLWPWPSSSHHSREARSSVPFPVLLQFVADLEG
jgi:hypothetical protein